MPSYSGSTTWSYDSKDRLAQESSARLGGYTDNFAYDTAGNPTTFSGSTRTYNSNNQRTGSGTFAYDGNGNPTTYTGGSFGTASCSYDRENRLTAIGSSWTAGYRSDGLRAWKQVGSTRTYYYYDNGNPILEYTSGDTVQAINGYAPDGLYARWTGSGAVYYTFDHQGSVAQRFDANGNVLASSMNDAYGNESATSSQSDPFSYNAKWGYQLDRESGLYLCQHRYYDPANGRWLTRDPIGYDGGVNVYGYCGGGPVGWVDSTGFVKIVVTWHQVLGPGYHAGIIIIDNRRGKKQPAYSVAGGPERNFPDDPGMLISKSGPWKPGQQDYEAHDGKWNGEGITIQDDDSSIDDWIGLFNCIEDEMRRKGSAPYEPVPGFLSFQTANSNSYLREVLERSGFLYAFDKGVRKRGGTPWLPGWAADVWGD